MPVKQRWLTVVTALALLTSCGPTTHRTTGHLANGKAFAVDIGYADKGVGFSVSGHADVADGTPATVDVTGPMHFRCHPTFQPPAAHDGDAIDNLPSFGLAFVPPSGSYTVIVEVPGSGGKLTSHVDLDKYHGGGPPTSGAWWHDRGCILVADSAAQQRDYVARDISELRRRIEALNEPLFVKQKLQTTLDGSDQLLVSLTSAQDQAATTAAYTAAIQRLHRLSSVVDAVREVPPDDPYGFTLQQVQDQIDETIGMLSQSGLQ